MKKYKFLLHLNNFFQKKNFDELGFAIKFTF